MRWNASWLVGPWSIQASCTRRPDDCVLAAGGHHSQRPRAISEVSRVVGLPRELQPESMAPRSLAQRYRDPVSSTAGDELGRYAARAADHPRGHSALDSHVLDSGDHRRHGQGDRPGAARDVDHPARDQTRVRGDPLPPSPGCGGRALAGSRLKPSGRPRPRHSPGRSPALCPTSSAASTTTVNAPWSKHCHRMAAYRVTAGSSYWRTASVDALSGLGADQPNRDVGLLVRHRDVPDEGEEVQLEHVVPLPPDRPQRRDQRGLPVGSRR